MGVRIAERARELVARSVDDSPDTVKAWPLMHAVATLNTVNPWGTEL